MCAPDARRYIEAWGGLDDYLLQTPDRKLNSDAASLMKWRISQQYQAKGLSRYVLTASEREKALLAGQSNPQ